MSRSTKRTLRRSGAGAALAVGAITAFGVVAPAAMADGGTVAVSNTETVQAYLDSTGKLDVARVYEQIAMQGKGTVTVTNPVSAKGLRNLDGFSGFEVKDGAVVGTYTVDGEQRIRTVSDYDKKLPLKVSVTYLLDGKTVEPAAVVGATGRLEVKYRVENVTGKPQDVTYPDGTGATLTSTESVPIPMVGSLGLVLPPSFTDVTSAEANMAGDGRGGTKMSFTMTLFPPIGSPVAEFGYAAHISGGVVPAASITALPVSPLDSPSFKAGAASYKGGADTGVKLTDGATQIDTNLLKLRDGSATLLAGLIQLRDGADQLRSGLANEAAPGAEKLADGAGQVDSGANQLADGLTQAGAKAPALIAGLAAVQDGLAQVDAGLTSMYDGIGGLPTKAQPLHAGIAQLIAGIGTTNTNGTLLFGVDQIRSQTQAALAPGGDVDLLAQGVGGIKQYIAAASSGIATASTKVEGIKINAACLADSACAQLAVDAASALASATGASAGATGTAAAVSSGIDQLKLNLGNAVVGLIKVECGLSNTTLPGYCDPARPGLLQGLGALDAGISQLVSGVVAQIQGGIGGVSDTPANKTLRGGINGLQAGVSQIQAGGATLLSGLDQLSDGADRLSVGTGQLADGANDLAEGLNSAADGSGQIADGLGKAVDGATQIPDGAGRLSTEGTKELIKAGQGTASDYGKKYAVIEAGAARAKAEGMAYGAPAGAAGFTAYSLELAGMDGQGAQSTGRLFTGVAAFGAAAGLALWRRRSLA